MRSNICLLILPISDFLGLMRRHVGLLSKLGLWSLRVIKASLFAVILILSSRASLVAIVLASASVDMMLSGFDFLYDLSYSYAVGHCRQLLSFYKNCLSSDEESFKKAAAPYQQSINDSGYDYELRYEPPGTTTHIAETYLQTSGVNFSRYWTKNSRKTIL